ncbi:hypothetical protein BGW39_010497, partial [Mortierella sp. 14UC]
MEDVAVTDILSGMARMSMTGSSVSLADARDVVDQVKLATEQAEWFLSKLESLADRFNNIDR